MTRRRVGVRDLVNIVLVPFWTGLHGWCFLDFRRGQLSSPRATAHATYASTGRQACGGDRCPVNAWPALRRRVPSLAWSLASRSGTKMVRPLTPAYDEGVFPHVVPGLVGTRRRRGGGGTVAGQPAPDFAGLLRQLRAEAGLTQEELAEAAGLGLRTVSDLERGAHRTAHQDTARSLADALRLTEPVRGLFVAAARGRVSAAEVLAARVDALTSLAAVATGDRPPVATAPVVPRELPADVSAFTGRSVELTELDLLLPSTSQGEAGGTVGPVVISAVSGTAGVGKTALAVRWAHQVVEAFPGGQLYVNLRGYDPDRPMAAGDALAGFLRALGVAGPDIPPETAERAARYRSLVAGRRLLVVLDNAASEEQVRPLLPGSASVMVVVTSRDSLAGLVARDGARRLDLDLLPQADAVALLRALVGWRAESDPEAAGELARLCARLPLALRVAAELAAARPDTPLAVLAAELADEADRLRLLAAGGDPRSAVASVFSWSYRHLPPDAARMFRLLGLHPGADWDRYAAAALTATSLAQALQLLGVLARAHLIQPVGPHRYSMHDLLRAYAVSQATSHDTDQARYQALTRLFDYYLTACGHAMDRVAPQEHHLRPSPPPVTSPVPEFSDLATALDWLNTELATLTGVAAYTAENGWPSHTTRLAITLIRYLTGGHDTEALTINTYALNAARDSGDLAAEAEVLHTLGFLHLLQGRIEQAADCYQRSLTIARNIGDQHMETWALGGLGLMHHQKGHYQQAADYLSQASALARERGDQIDEGIFEGNLANLYIKEGRYRQAARIQRRHLALSRQRDDLSGVAYALVRLGASSFGKGRYQQAADHLGQALTAARALGDRWLEAATLAWLGDLRSRQGRYNQAAEYHQQALAIWRETGVADAEAESLNGAGEILLATGHPGQARTCHTTALAMSRESGDRYLQARALTRLGRVSYCQGQHAQAAEYHQQALVLSQGIGNLGGQVEALNGAGEAFLATGEPGQAHVCHTTALVITRQTGDRYQQARAHYGLAATCQTSGHDSEAEQHWQEALNIYTDLGVPEATHMRTQAVPAVRASPRAGE